LENHEENPNPFADIQKYVCQHEVICFLLINIDQLNFCVIISWKDVSR